MITKNFCCIFFLQFLVIKPWIWIHLKCWIRIRTRVRIQWIRNHSFDFLYLKHLISYFRKTDGGIHPDLRAGHRRVCGPPPYLPPAAGWPGGAPSYAPAYSPRYRRRQAAGVQTAAVRGERAGGGEQEPPGDGGAGGQSGRRQATLQHGLTPRLQVGNK